MAVVGANDWGGSRGDAGIRADYQLIDGTNAQVRRAWALFHIDGAYESWRHVLHQRDVLR